MRSQTFKSNNYTILLETFSDIHEFVNLSDNREENSWSHHTEINNSDRDYLLHGWDMMRDKINDQLSKIGNVTTQERKITEKIYTYNGYYPNVSRAVRGNPRCMGKYVKHVKDTKIVEVIWDPGAAWNVDEDEIAEQGIKLLAKIKSLELAGYRVKLMVQGFKGERYEDEAYLCRITVKEENQFLDLSRISYPLASDGMLRKWVFHWYEHLPRAKFIDGYGKSLYLWDERRRKEILDAVNVRSNQYYVNLGTNIEQTFKPLLERK